MAPRIGCGGRALAPPRKAPHSISSRRGRRRASAPRRVLPPTDHRPPAQPSMKVASAAATSSPGPSCALKRVRLGGGAGEAARCLSEQSVSLSRAGGGSPRGLPLLEQAEQAAAAASLLYDMKGCYSRLQALVPTLPRHRRVSKVEILQHVIDYIWDLQLELQHPPARGQPLGGGPDGEPSGAAEAACVSDRILCH